MKIDLRGDRTMKKDRNKNQWLQYVPHLETDQRARTNTQESTVWKTSKLRKLGNMEIAGTQFLISQVPQPTCGIDCCGCN